MTQFITYAFLAWPYKALYLFRFLHMFLLVFLDPTKFPAPPGQACVTSYLRINLILLRGSPFKPRVVKMMKKQWLNLNTLNCGNSKTLNCGNSNNNTQYCENIKKKLICGNSNTLNSGNNISTCNILCREANEIFKLSECWLFTYH